MTIVVVRLAAEVPVWIARLPVTADGELADLVYVDVELSADLSA
ncbi:hypothetical protein [Micromonospora craterilacus]|nr:hypothetical protein [Micromonospora craterilacus]